MPESSVPEEHPELTRERILLAARKEILAYRALLWKLKALPRLSLVENTGLAFLVSDMKASFLEAGPKYPESKTWMEDFSKFAKQLEEKCPNGELSGITALLAEEIFIRYDHFLSEKLALIKAPKYRESLELLQKFLRSIREQQKQLQANGEIVPLGGVIPEHTPTWFKILNEKEGRKAKTSRNHEEEPPDMRNKKPMAKTTSGANNG